MYHYGWLCEELTLISEMYERRGGVVVSMPAWHAGDLGWIPGPGMFILGVKTWLSTLEIVNLSVFRMRQ